MAEKYIFICAGESSGDALGSQILSYFAKKSISSSRFTGTGGQKMEAAGFASEFPISNLAVNGFSEVFKNRRFLKQVLTHLRALIQKPECVGCIFIDYPGMNMRLMKTAQKAGKPVYYVAPPQIWAWKQSRGKQFEGIDCAVFFPFEEEIYKKYRAKVVGVTHPSVKLIRKAKTTDSESGEMESFRKILLCCGSRKADFLRHFPFAVLFLETLLQEVEDAFEFSFLIEDSLRELPEVQKVLRPLKLEQVSPSDEEAIASHSLAISLPGTNSLELGLRGIPHIVYYKSSWLKYLWGRYLLRLPHLSLVNLLLKQKALQEVIFVQNYGQGQIPSSTHMQMIKAAVLDLMSRESQIRTKLRELPDTLYKKDLAETVYLKTGAWLNV